MAASNDFHNVLFPPDISYGSSGGPQFKTTIFTSDSGYEQRNQDWANTRAQYDVSQAIKSQTQMDSLTNFFFARRGRAFGFLFQDWNDFQISNQTIGVGDGTTTVFQMIKTYSSGSGYDYTRTITKIMLDVTGTPIVAGMQVGAALKAQNTDYTVDPTTGLITFTTAPPANAPIVCASAQFLVPVRFDTDHLDVTQEFWETSSWPNIPLVEVREWGQVMS